MIALIGCVAMAVFLCSLATRGVAATTIVAANDAAAVGNVLENVTGNVLESCETARAVPPPAALLLRHLPLPLDHHRALLPAVVADAAETKKAAAVASAALSVVAVSAVVAFVAVSAAVAAVAGVATGAAAVVVGNAPPVPMTATTQLSLPFLPALLAHLFHLVDFHSPPRPLRHHRQRETNHQPHHHRPLLPPVVAPLPRFRPRGPPAAVTKPLTGQEGNNELIEIGL